MKNANTKTKTAAKNERIYREMSEPFMTIAGDSDTETTLNATVVAAIDPKTQTKTYSFAVKRGTTGVRNDGTEWHRWTSVTLPLDVDVLDAMIERVQKIRDQILANGTQGGKAYKLNAKDVQFMQMQGDDDDTPAEPKAAKAAKAAKGKTQESAPTAADDDVTKTAGWLVENAGKVVNGEKFIKHLIKSADAYGGKNVLQKAGNVLAAKYGKDKLMGQPAIETIAAHIAGLFFKPETKPEVKPAVNKKPVVNMPPALGDDEDDDDDGSNTPAKSAKPKGKPAAIDLADDLDDLEDLIGDLEL